MFNPKDTQKKFILLFILKQTKINETTNSIRLTT